MITKSTNSSMSRYVWGGTTEVYPTRLGWWSRRVFAVSDTDTTITLPIEYDRRPDLLAYDLYGKSGYASVILQYNNILDINLEFVSGITLRIPSKTRVDFDIVNKSVNSSIPP